MSRRASLRVVAGAFAVVAARALWLPGPLRRALATSVATGATLRKPLRPVGMMGTDGDMSTYSELFARHAELRRRVELVPGGVRTVTESDSHELVAQLQAHVATMYGHLERGEEVTCMSASLPLLFRHADGYRRTLKLIPTGVVVTETSSDPAITKAIREHASEVTGFVRIGMQAMMQGGMSR